MCHRRACGACRTVHTCGGRCLLRAIAFLLDVVVVEHIEVNRREHVGGAANPVLHELVVQHGYREHVDIRKNIIMHDHSDAH